MLASYPRCIVFLLCVVVGLTITGWLLLYKTTSTSYLLPPRLSTFAQLFAATTEAEDTVWGAWDRTWIPPGDDEDWGKINCPVPTMRNTADFYDYIDRRQVNCNKMVMVGGFHKPNRTFMMGEKWVCMDERFNVVPGRCLALSFGIASDYSFDDDMDKRFNCKVYAFDHTINTKAYQRSPNVKFYDIGIASKDHLTGNAKVARYITLLKKLQLEHAVIDYLKLDVEGAEFPFFSDVFTNTPNLLKNVKQIGMELHIHSQPHRDNMWKYFSLLRCYGFKVMFSEVNPVKHLKFKLDEQERSCCYEVVWARDKQW